MVRLLGEVAALPGTHFDKKRHLMEGLCRLTDSDAWAWGLAAEMNPDKLPVYVGFQHGGFTDEQLGWYLKLQAHPDMVWVSAPLSNTLLEHEGQHVTRDLQRITGEEAFLSADVAALWRACGHYPRALSFFPLGDGAFSGIALYRKVGKPLFTDRETRIAHIIMSEVPWLHLQGWPEDRGASVPHLSLRQHTVLEMLLQSFSRKRIADELGISIHTVSGYVKEIYRHFGVNSHAELLGRFYQGDGGDSK
jgi:DNA-binding CsgD family transcriptional regulator